jgi:hypothetical protein
VISIARAQVLDTTYVVNLAGRSTANSVGDTNAVDANLVDSAVKGQKIDEIGAERVLAGN